MGHCRSNREAWVAGTWDYWMEIHPSIPDLVLTRPSSSFLTIYCCFTSVSPSLSSLWYFLRMENLPIKPKNSPGKWNSMQVYFNGPFLSPWAAPPLPSWGGWMHYKADPAAHVTSSYWGDVDHGQTVETRLEGVYCVVTKGKQFREFKFHLRRRKNVKTVVGRLPKAWAPNCFLLIPNNLKVLSLYSGRHYGVMFKMCTSVKSLSLEIGSNHTNPRWRAFTVQAQICRCLCGGVVYLLVFKQPSTQNPTLWFWSWLIYSWILHLSPPAPLSMSKASYPG